MPTMKRQKTQYPGVYYIESKSPVTGKPEKVFYIFYRKGGRQVEEKAGRQFKDGMTPARAARLRAQRIDGNQPSNKERREAAKAKEEAEAERWTINRLWAEYKAQRPNLKGIVTDENRFKNYIAPNFGTKEPADLILLDVDRLRIRLLKKLAPQTVKHILALLKRITSFGAKKGLCDPLSFTIEMPSVDNQRTEDLNPEQLIRLMDAIEVDSNVPVANMMKMALFTGMRRGELFKLEWQDIDFDRGFIMIRDPKGGKPQRIPLNDNARTVLGTVPQTGGSLVFPNPQGGQRSNIRPTINRIKKRAGLPKDFRPMHGLRHVYASMLASSGQVDMYTLQKLLTHKSPLMTQRYAHLRDEALKKASDLAADLFDQAINGQTKGKVVNITGRDE